MDGASRLWFLDGDISPQELAVAKGDSTGSIDTYYILIRLVDLNDDTCLVPLFWDVDLSGFEYVHGG